MNAAVQAQLEVLRRADRFFEASLLCSLARLRVFEALGERARSRADLATSLGLDPDLLARVLLGATGLGLLEHSADGYSVPVRLRPVLCDPNDDAYVGNWLRYLGDCQRAVLELPAILREPDRRRRATTGPWRDPADLRTATLAMHDYAKLRGRGLAEVLDTSGVRRLLDLGCGPGTYAYQLARRDPTMSLTLVDRREALGVARELAQQAAVPNPVRYVEGDLRDDPLPEGPYDLVLLSNVLMSLGEREARAILPRIVDELADGGQVVVHSPMPRDGGLAARWPVIVDLLLVCTTEEGRVHTVEDTLSWMKEAGLTSIRRLGLGPLAAADVVVGRRE